MLAFLRDANTSQSVIDVFEWLDGRLGGKLFSRLFPVIVSDNGSEFSNPKKLEYRDYAVPDYGFQRTSIYYCDAGCPYQKGAIEVNHELIRRVLPNGTSFDNLTQTDVTRMMDYINSYKRKKLNDRTKAGVDFPITKKSRGSRPPFGVPVKVIIHEKKGLEQVASRVQNAASHLQIWHLVYKTGVSFTNMQFSIYKQASRLTNWRLGLQLSDINLCNCSIIQANTVIYMHMLFHKRICCIYDARACSICISHL